MENFNFYSPTYFCFGKDWASHGIEHELSALYDCAHGAGLAVIMPHWMEYVMNHGAVFMRSHFFSFIAP